MHVCFWIEEVKVMFTVALHLIPIALVSNGPSRYLNFSLPYPNKKLRFTSLSTSTLGNISQIELIFQKSIYIHTWELERSSLKHQALIAYYLFKSKKKKKKREA